MRSFFYVRESEFETQVLNDGNHVWRSHFWRKIETAEPWRPSVAQATRQSYLYGTVDKILSRPWQFELNSNCFDGLRGAILDKKIFPFHDPGPLRTHFRVCKWLKFETAILIIQAVALRRIVLALEARSELRCCALGEVSEWCWSERRTCRRAL